jgi:hypothetical protein
VIRSLTYSDSQRAFDITTTILKKHWQHIEESFYGDVPGMTLAIIKGDMMLW